MFDQETIEPEAAPRESEADRVTKWRATELSRAGYDEYSAWTIAVQADVDLHLAVDLVHQGCPPATALRILL